VAPERVARYIQGVRLYCPSCVKQITPVTYLINDANGMTTGIEFGCDSCNTILKKAVL
jgi:hypothetical protein